MTQISRPFQIALLAVAVLGAVWIFAFRAHPSSTSSSGSSPAVSAAAPTTAATSTAATASTAAAEAKAAAAPSKVYHGSAPGVEGLTRAVAKAHGAVAASQQNAKAVEQEAPQTAGEGVSARSASSAASSSASPAKAVVPAAANASASPAKGGASPKRSASVSSSLTGQRTVEAQLAHGNVAVVLFWDAKGTDDVDVHRALRAVAKLPGVSVDEAPASAVSSYGTVTRGVQIYETPTLLVINKRGQAAVLTGVQDAYSIEQAINEARHA
jgi:hypothetical protein